MKKNDWKPYVFFIVLAEAVGGLSGWLTRKGVKSYNANVAKPTWTPPSAVFPIVWVILFALMGIGAARVYLSRSSLQRSRGLSVFGVQLAVNFFWSILFFNFQTFGIAFGWLCLLWVLIWWMIATFAKVDRPAAWLQLPYLLWVAFAGVLNFFVWMMNR